MGEVRGESGGGRRTVEQASRLHADPPQLVWAQDLPADREHSAGPGGLLPAPDRGWAPISSAAERMKAARFRMLKCLLTNLPPRFSFQTILWIGRLPTASSLQSWKRRSALCCWGSTGTRPRSPSTAHWLIWESPPMLLQVRLCVVFLLFQVPISSHLGSPTCFCHDASLFSRLSLWNHLCSVWSFLFCWGPLRP